MKPDSTVIYFTVCLGTGYGIIVSLILIFFQNEITIDQNIKLIIATISYFLIVSGLLSSTLHLGHPKEHGEPLVNGEVLGYQEKELPLYSHLLH